MTDNNNNQNSRPTTLSLKSLIARIVAILLIIGIGILLTVIIKSSGPKPSRIQAKMAIPTVLTKTVKLHPTLSFPLHALGTVIPSSQVTISPRISGTIFTTGTFEPGQRYQNNDIIAQLDPSDFKLAHTQRIADLASAQTALKRELGQRRISAHEWEVFQDKAHASDLERELILRDPELRSAQTLVASAQAAVDLAQLHIDRCTIRAPFDCILISKNIGVGSQVSPQTAICEVSALSFFWVRASLPTSSLQHLIADSESGSAATLTLAGNPDGAQWHGQLIRILPTVENQGLLASVLIAVSNPLDTDTPLLLGSSVRVTLNSRPLINIIPIATAYIHSAGSGNNAIASIWTLGTDTTLSIKNITVKWVEGDTAFISEGLHANDIIITSTLHSAIDGMKLRLPEKESSPTSAFSAPQTHSTEK